MSSLHLQPAWSNPVPPETEDSKARAREAQETERAEALARILAHFNGIHDLHAEPEATRQHFAQWGLIAVRGSSLGARQFRCVALALHAAAQAGHDCDASQEHYAAQDLLAERNAHERYHWSLVATRIVRAYHHVLGGQTTRTAMDLYGPRLFDVTESPRPMEVGDDPRRI
jgi:hypothetical protein